MFFQGLGGRVLGDTSSLTALWTYLLQPRIGMKEKILISDHCKPF